MAGDLIMSEFTKSQLKCDLVNDRFVLEQEVIWEVGELGSGNFITIPAGKDAGCIKPLMF